MMYTSWLGRITNGTAVAANGGLPRWFVEQNKAKLQWSIKESRSMSNNYAPDRERARTRNYSANDAQLAVFASDASYRNIAFPIRSGYFFNPTGTYTFTITTELYKKKDEETEEHKCLVNELIRSFRYESNMVYINPNTRQPVGIDNVEGRPELYRNTYRIPSAFVSIKGSDEQLEQPEFISGNELVWLKSERNYAFGGAQRVQRSHPTSDIDLNFHANVPSYVTDPRFQRVLEGYTASDTKDSRINYKYTEYVAPGVDVYKVTETTTVTITVNPYNRPLYTHAMMSNGTYYARALTTDINLGSLRVRSGTQYQLNNGLVSLGSDEDYQLNNLRKADASEKLYGYVLDLIQVGVVGSIFDDMR